MSNMYRLKPEAVPFFRENLATQVLSKVDWKEHWNVDEKALEEVKPMYVLFGTRLTENDRSSSLSGWSQEDGQHFNFSIHFPSVKWCEHDKFSKGQMTRELMNRIQRQCERFYEEYLEMKGGENGI